tara:strand:- start:430 stop:681 length:252 start_codon:yes stop_codon:yes gene_type:complete
MRLDPEHVERLRVAISANDGNQSVELDMSHLSASLHRLSLWEGGLLIDSLMRAAQSQKLSREQRVLLALFVPPTGHGDGPHAD